MTQNAGSDLRAAVDTSLITKLFDSLSYPWTMHIPGLREDLSQTVDHETFIEEGAGDPGDEVLGEDLLTNAIDAFIAIRQKASLQTKTEIEKSLEDLFADYVAAGQRGEDELRAAIIDGIGKDQQKFAERFETFLQRGPKVEVKWAEVRMSKKPAASMGNPITFTHLEFEVRAKVEACIKVFGKKYCASATTPWTHFKAENAHIAIEVVGLKVRARPRVKNLDLEIKIKIWKWTYTIRIGVTTHVNNMLDRVTPTLLDLTGKSFPVPALNRVYAPVKIAVPSHASETSVEITGEVR